VSAPKHSGTFSIISRNPNVWQAKCERHATWTAATYAEAEDLWREHVWQETGHAPKPTRMDDSPRWEAS